MRKNCRAGCTGRTWGTVITSAMIPLLRLAIKSCAAKPRNRTERNRLPRDVLEYADANEQRGDEGGDDSPTVQRKNPLLARCHYLFFGAHGVLLFAKSRKSVSRGALASCRARKMRRFLPLAAWPLGQRSRGPERVVFLRTRGAPRRTSEFPGGDRWHSRRSHRANPPAGRLPRGVVRLQRSRGQAYKEPAWSCW